MALARSMSNELEFVTILRVKKSVARFATPVVPPRKRAAGLGSPHQRARWCVEHTHHLRVETILYCVLFYFYTAQYTRQ